MSRYWFLLAMFVASNYSGAGELKSESSYFDFDVLRVDYKSMQGKTIKLHGVGSVTGSGNAIFLRKNTGDSYLMAIGIDNLPREQKLILFKKCSNVLQPCTVDVIAKISKGYAEADDLFLVGKQIVITPN